MKKRYYFIRWYAIALAIFTIAAIAPFQIHAQIITTIAGGGAFGGDGLMATASHIDPPGVAVDDCGNIFIVDYMSSRIRKVSTNGIVSTVAGNGTNGYSGDGGPATNAQLHNPIDITLDGAGNLYIVDMNNHCIRMVTTTGIITTVAGNGIYGYGGDGGPATAARFATPAGVAVDAAGNIYIADDGNNRIRKVNTSGMISTVVGAGSMGFSGDGGPATAALLHFPAAVAVDNSGNIYISDGANYRIRKVNSAGIINSIAGTTAGYSGDGGPATSAQMDFPFGLDVDSAGNVFFSDYYNNRVRKIDTFGIITTIAGNGFPGFAGDGGAATAATVVPEDVRVTRYGTYIADNGNSRIRFIAGTTPLLSPINGLTSLCVGDNTTLTEALSGGSWSSSNAAVATIGSASGVMSGITGGTATITYTLVSGCYVTASITVNPLPAPITGITSVCPGATTTLSDLTPGGAWSSSNPASATVGSSTGIVTGVTIGTTPTITYTLPTGCYTTIVVTVTSVSLPIAGPPTVCAGATITLTHIISGGTWSSSNTATATVGSSTGVVSGVATGIVTITYSVTACIYTKSITVNPAPLPITGPSVVCASSAITLSDLTVGGTWSGSDITIATVGSLSGIVTGVATGTVTITYTATSGCTAIKSITVNPQPAPITGATSVCLGSTAVAICGSPGGVWSSGSPAIAVIGATTGIITGLTPGTVNICYAFTGTGCSRCTIITVNPLPPLTTVTGGGSYCAGGTGLHIGVNPSAAGIDYQLMLGTSPVGAPIAGTGGALDFGPQTAAGTYTVIATDPVTGCSRTMTGSAVITINPLPVPVSGPSAVCVGGTITLSDAGGGTWTSSTPTVATIGAATGIVTGVTIGITTITYALPTGCLTTKTVTVSSGTVPLVLPTICVGSSATLTSGIPGGVWSSSSATVTISSLSGIVTGVAVGTATITYSLGAGCTVTGTMSVSPGITAITGPSTACIGSTITLSDATPGGSWSSSDILIATISAGGIVTGISNGVVTITYTAGGCNATKLITVSTTPAPIVGPASMCASICITETDATAGGTWSSSATVIATAGSSSGIVCAVSAGIATITYSIGGCYATKPVSVLATPAPVSGLNHVCVGSLTTLTDAVTGGIWSSSDAAVATVGSTGIVTGILSGTAIISYTLGTGCYATLTITVNPAPGAITAPPGICAGNCTTVTDPTPGGSWSATPATVGTISTAGTFCGIAAGVATITYSLGCAVTATVTVTPLPAPVTGTTNVCVGSATILSDAVPGGTWGSSMTSIATVGSGTGIVTGVSSGTVIISYAIGSCSVITAVVVNPILPISGTPVVCVGQTTPLTDSALGGTWSSSAPATGSINSSGIVTGITAGTTVISYTLPTGCYTTVVVTVHPLPAAISGPSAMCLPSCITETDATPGGTWSSSMPAIATVTSTGMVCSITAGTTTISYTIATGCAATKTITVFSTPPSISGADVICTGTCSTFTDALTGGIWSSSSSVAIVGSSSGLVCAGPSAGTVTLTYNAGTGCTTTKPVTVDVPPAPITGPGSLCPGNSILLTDATAGGAWSSSNPVIADVGSATGIVTGNVTGVAIVSYTRGCPVTKTVTVNVVPSPIYGTTNICTGATTLLTNMVGGGTWSTSDTTIATAGALTGIVTGITPGTVTISYSLATGCSTSVSVVVALGVGPITGINTVCVGTVSLLNDITPGGTWSSSAPTVATISGTGVVTGVSLGTTIISYTVGALCPSTRVASVNPGPGPITGSTSVCVGSATTLGNSTGGGTWSSSDTTVAAINPVSGVVTGISAGTGGLATITYTMGAGCFATFNIVVMPLPAPVSGPNTVCATQTITLFDATFGGTWSSGTTSVATVGSLTGVVSGVSAGIVLISYTSSTGCSVTYPVTVYAMPSPVTGSSSVCLAGAITLSDAVPGGTWSSIATGIAAVGSASGIVTGVSLGTTTIVYQMPGGCFVTKGITVLPLPAPFTVTGGGNYCAGGIGVPVGLSSSAVGVNYMLYRGTTAVGAFAGTGVAIDFGLQTIIGTYTVVGASTATGCSVTMTGSAVVSIVPDVTPSVTFTTIPSDTICNGGTVIFTPVPVNGGTAPTYRWRVNGTPVALTTTYSYIPANGDIVKVTMTSNATCPVPDTASFSDTMDVTPFGTPTVSLFANPGDTICTGTPVTVNAIPAFGGSAPVYTWFKDGFYVGGGSSYSFVPNNADQVFCILLSNYPCRLADIDTSLYMRFVVDTPALPTIFIGASPGTTILPGQADTLTAIVSNATAPTYQWFLNGIPVPGATTNTYVSSSFSYPKPDSVSCLVTSHGVCEVSAHQWLYINVTKVGVSQLAGGSDITVLPNPNRGEFIITGSLASVNDEEVFLEITDMLGQVVFTKKAVTPNGKINERIQLRKNLANGMYMLMLRSGIDNKVFHIVIEQ